MGAALSSMRHVRGFDVARPLSIAPLRAIMPPLIFLPLSTDMLAIHPTSSYHMPSGGARLLTRASAS